MIKRIKIEGLDCAVCAGKVEERIKKVDGVINANVNFFMQQITLEYQDGADLSKLIKTIKKEIKKIEPECEIDY